MSEQEYSSLNIKMAEKYRYDHFEHIFNLHEDLKNYCIDNGLNMLSGYNSFNDLSDLIEKNTFLIQNMVYKKMEEDNTTDLEYDDIEEYQY